MDWAPISKSSKLDDVCYDIRGPVLTAAEDLEREGAKVLKLNIGNPAPFGFDAPDELLHDVIVNLRQAQGYIDSRGLFAARKAVMQHYQPRGLGAVSVDDVYVGNGVSELISLSMQALLNTGDEVLIPSPDYPLWTAAVTLAGGLPVHYRCDEQSDWLPAMDDLEALVTPRTRALVVINPNNPTGAVYPPAVLSRLYSIAAAHKLVIFADEIYDKILYDGRKHVSIASLGADVPCCTLSGLSKAYRAAGFRAGWMVLSGPRGLLAGFREGLDMLVSKRLCANAPAQFAVQAALGGYQSIADLVLPTGRLGQQRDAVWSLINDIPGLSSVRPAGALYLFPRIDIKRFGILDDMQFVLDFLREKHVLLVHGRGFNWPHPDHFRVVFLPNVDDLRAATSALADFLDGYTQ